jgi:DNA repair protein RecO (recombination protein O)
MSRAVVHQALVLSVRAFGESHREATFLTAEAGLVRAALFGGPKSKLRAHVAPYHRGALYLYHDPVRDSRKVTDFDVGSWRPGLRENLERLEGAAAAAETVLASHGGGGNWPRALLLADATLDFLADAPSREVPLALVRFFWRWADLLGARPDMAECPGCACSPAGDEVVWYSASSGGLLCQRCSGGAGFELGPGARRWLEAIDATADERTAARIGLDAAGSLQVRRFAAAVLAAALGVRPRSWAALEGQ